tara:strand:+ start:83 stop:418 length:336 start_codon:yes stop_codon:yes gene_type:complete
MNLENLQLEFSKWRKNKKSRAEPIPDHLWDNVFKLADKYSTALICKKLSISGTQFNKNQQRLYKEAQSKFVEIALPQENYTLQVQTKDKTLSLNISPKQLETIIPLIMQTL